MVVTQYLQQTLEKDDIYVAFIGSHAFNNIHATYAFS
jgi:hypothetical protein